MLVNFSLQCNVRADCASQQQQRVVLLACLLLRCCVCSAAPVHTVPVAHRDTVKDVDIAPHLHPLPTFLHHICALCRSLRVTRLAVRMVRS